MNDNELNELNRQYVQAVLDECRLVHRPEHIIDTLADLRVRHEPGSPTSAEGYSVLDDAGQVCGPRVTVADLGATKYAMESMKQCVSDNKEVMLDMHSDLMAVRGGGDTEGGAESLPSYKAAAPASDRMGVPKTFDELMREHRSRDLAKDVAASMAEIVAKRRQVNLSRRRALELDDGRNVDELRALDESAAARSPAANEGAAIEEAEQEQGVNEGAAIEEAEQEQGAVKRNRAEEATIEPKRKNPKFDMEERMRKFPELRPYRGHLTDAENKIDIEERLRKFPELRDYQG